MIRKMFGKRAINTYTTTRTLQYYHVYTPSDVKEDLEALLGEAEMVYDSMTFAMPEYPMKSTDRHCRLTYSLTCDRNRPASKRLSLEGFKPMTQHGSLTVSSFLPL